MPVAELKAGARNLILENAPKLFFVSIIYVIIGAVISELSIRLPGTEPAFDQMFDSLMEGEQPDYGLFFDHLRPSGAALALLLWLLGSVIHVGFMNYCLKKSRKQDADYKDIFDAFAFFVKIMLIQIITTVLIFLWSILFFIPGIVAYYRYRQAYYILLDNPNKGVINCINESKRLMHGNKINLFLLDLSFLGWHIIDFMTILLIPSPFMFPIISIWLSPYIGLSRAAFYNHQTGT